MSRGAVESDSAAAPPKGPFNTRLAKLVWYRSLTGAGRTYLTTADGGAHVTFAGLRGSCDRWAALLDDLGVSPGGTVGLAVTAPIDFALAFLGVVAAGRVAGPMDPRGTDLELRAACDRVAPELVVSDRSAPAGSAGFDWVVLAPGAYALDRTAPDAPSAAAPAAGPTAGEVDAAVTGTPGSAPGAAGGGLVLTTSGTSGTPKRMRLSEAQLLHTAAAVASHHRLTVADRGFSPLPLFHINAEVVGLLANLTAGSTLVLDDRFHRTGFWETLARQRITWINAVPAILSHVVPLRQGETVPERIRFARSASAPLPLAVLARFEATTGVPVVETYGMTEAASQIAANPVEGQRRAGSVGKPVGTEVRVAAPEGSVGLVYIRGAGVIDHYDSPGYEDRFDPDGWLDTGDLGRFDEDGWLYLVGRADDVVNCGGEKVYPREIEEVLLADPGVAGAAVVGEEHQVLGQVPVAFVVAAGEVDDPGGPQSAEVLVRRLATRCDQQLSKHRRPVAYHVVAQLPQGTNGKLRRRDVGGEPVIYSLLIR